MFVVPFLSAANLRPGVENEAEELKMKAWMLSMLSAVFLLPAGCANWDGYAGVENSWRASDVPVWEPGVTTAADVAGFLGPPSQLIPLHDETVFYYMREGKGGSALLLLVWNSGTQVTEYDRAIFFFDRKGVLKTYCYSNEELPYEAGRNR